MDGHATGDSGSVLLTASYYKENEYIWFRPGDLNGF